MSQASINETAYFGHQCSLLAVDFHFDPANQAHCSRRSDGSILFRLHVEPGFKEVILVLNDGVARTCPFTRVGQGLRFDYWETVLHPNATEFRYSFALLHESGRYSYFQVTGLTHAIETPYEFDAAQHSVHRIPDWAKGAIMYQIFPERFANGRVENDPAGVVPWGTMPDRLQFQGGDLWGIIDKLDYLKALGIDLLYLNPINTSPSNHKFDAINFKQVDPALGGDEALHALVAALHARDMRIILDASFNHCHPDFFAFKDLATKNEASSYKEWFTVYDYPIRIKYRPAELDLERSPWHAAWLKSLRQELDLPFEELEDEGPLIQPTYDGWYGVATMPQLRQENPETRAYFLDVARYWIREFGIDGWRMDVVQFVTPEFWPEFRAAVHAENEDVYLMSEVWGDTAFWLQGDQFDGTMNYLFRDICIDYFAQATTTTEQLIDAMWRMQALYTPEVNQVNQNLLSSHDVPRFRRLCGEREERWQLATFFQMTVPGLPSIYYGDEVGLTGDGDPDCRRPFPWHDESSWHQESLSMSTALTALRHQSAALRLGSWRDVAASDGCLAYLREYDGERWLCVIQREKVSESISVDVSTESAAIKFGRATIAIEPDQLQIHALDTWSGVIVQLS